MATQLAYKVDDVENPDFVVRLKEPPENARRRVAAIVQRWGIPAKEKMEYTEADLQRLKAIGAPLPSDE